MFDLFHSSVVALASLLGKACLKTAGLLTMPGRSLSTLSLSLSVLQVYCTAPAEFDHRWSGSS